MPRQEFYFNGRTYKLEVSRASRTAYATQGQPETRYDHFYWEVMIYLGQKLVGVTSVLGLSDLRREVSSTLEYITR